MSDEEKMPEQIDFEDELRQYGRADPFNTFDIVVTSGDPYTITNPDHLALNGNTVLVAEAQTGIGFFRKNQVVAVHVHDDVFKPTESKRKKN